MQLSKKVRFRSIALKSLFLIFLFFPTSFLSASEKIDVKNIRYWSYPGYTRVVIDISGTAEFTEHRLYKPERLYLDIKNSRIIEEMQTNISIGNGMLKSVRAGQFDNSTVRVVLDLENIRNYKIFTLEEPSRIIADIYGPTVFSSKKRIVIDAGHGGKDPGAVGPKRLYEKDVVLDIALKLKKILSDNPDIEIHLTRDRDVYISLDERTAIANGKDAELFVSLHANASPVRNIKGIETYFLNWTNDEEAQKVAARENDISLKQMKNEMKKKKDVLDIMLGDLNRGYKRDESIKLANYVQQSMVNELDRNYRNIVDLGVKWSWFYVLVGAKMPSVLVEVSFISNPLEAKLLRKDSYRSDLARSIASGINRYMSIMPKGQTVADTRKSIASRD